jgi:hypothetical protein
MSRDSELSSELYDVMRHVVEHDFVIEHCRELLNVTSKSATEVSALVEHIRRHEVQRLKTLGLVAGLQLKLRSIQEL